MNTFFLFLLLSIWWAGTCLRAYKQARFYQIDEYKMGRYARWWVSKRERLLPMRLIITYAIGAIIIFIFSEAPNSPMPLIVGIVVSFIANIPPDEGEIKKKFRHTPRANRLLGATFLWLSITFILLWLVLGGLDLSERFLALSTLTIGLGIHLLAPLFLMLGNITMMPIEGALRGRFVASAKRVMHDINPTVIGITGSYGKTTTKVFLTEILNGRYKAYATPKSFNTMMGVCIAINNDLKNDYSINYFVVEMGAYIRGEIQRICDLTPPHIGIVIEVGPQHLERFGSLENTATAKYEIIKALPPDGVGVFNWDNPYVREMFERGYPQTRIAVSKTIAPSDAPDGVRFVASNITESLNGLSFTVTDTQRGESAQFDTPLLGEHNVTNLLLSTAVAVHEGMPLRDIALRARTLRPAESRLVRQEMAGITIINDAYSANPAGVISALKVLGLHTGRKLVITPGMIELGELHYPENYKLGQALKTYATDVILVGKEQTQPIYDGMRASGFPDDNLQVVDELREAITWYQTNLKAGDAVLFLNDLPDTY